MSESNKGRFGIFGGAYVPELLVPALEELEEAFDKYKDDEGFLTEYNRLLRDYAGRPTPLYHARNLSKMLGFKVYLKREDLVYGGSHKLNNSLGQAILAKKMGKKSLITETAAGQHGIAAVTAGTVCGLSTEVYMGTKDIERQASNVKRIKLLGGKIVPVKHGQEEGVLKDAVSACFRKWTTCSGDVFYLGGSAVGPHPYPTIVAHFQSVIGKEIKTDILEKEGKLPDAIIACGSGGSNAIGAFRVFIDDKDVALHFVEGGGEKLGADNCAAPFQIGSVGIIDGMKTYVLQDEDGQIRPSKCRAAGLNYPGRGPEMSYLVDSGRVKAGYALDSEVFEAVEVMAKTEGLIPALETAHAIAYLLKQKDQFGGSDIVVVNYSGRGDKDIDTILKYFGDKYE